ncbi:beta-ketoacyl reductase, partial [Streptomyces sp. NPDC006355]|uniref:beta-ketoacyl reductase n=1 Tax=Streptomyces sp. NPDC006355 TaxID=3156758 RepID=UPI0033AF23D7
LAHHRRAHGLPATSLSWGLWEQAGTGLTSRLADADIARMRRQGITALTTHQALTLLDTTLRNHHPHTVPVRLDLAALRREQDRGEELATLFRSLVRTRRRRSRSTESAPDALRDRLLTLPEDERHPKVVDLVRQEVAAVLGVADPADIGVGQVLKDLGIDSVMAVELRRRLAAESGTNLPATLAFDYPTPTAIAGLLLDRLDLGSGHAAVAVPRVTKDQINELVDRLRSTTPRLLESEDLVSRFFALQAALAKTAAVPDEPEVDIEDSSQEDLFAYLDRKFGVGK